MIVLRCNKTNRDDDDDDDDDDGDDDDDENDNDDYFFSLLISLNSRVNFDSFIYNDTCYINLDDI